MRAYVDCGAFDGDTIKLFCQAHPEADQFNLYAFEPNPAYTQALASLNDDPLVVAPVNVLPFAVWDEDKALRFYPADKPMGSTCVTGKRTNGVRYDRPTHVQAVSLANWLLATFTAEDEVILKLDIEGAEYRVVKQLIESDAVALLDRLYVEWHDGKIDGVDPVRTAQLVAALNERGFDLTKEVSGEHGRFDL